MGCFQRPDSAYWWISFSHKGTRYRFSTGTDNRKLAEQIHAKVILEIRSGQYFPETPEQRITVTELLTKYLAEYAPVHKKPGTVRRDRSLAAHLVKAFGAMTLGQVTPAQIAAYQTARQATGASAGTVNRELALARHAFNVAIRQWEWASRNPFTVVTREREPKGRDRWLREDEERGLLAACPTWLRNLIVFALETGMRLGEILALPWRNVDLARQTVYVAAGTTKSAFPRTIPLRAKGVALLAAIQARPRAVASVLVFPSRRGRLITQGTVNRAFRRALARAGIADFRFHDLRHTFATRLCQAGVNLYVVQRLLGHQDPKMTQRYAHHCTESLQHGLRLVEQQPETRRSRFGHGAANPGDLAGATAR